MNFDICKWYNNAASPVLLFIDDFANVWVDRNENGSIDLEEDWGYAKDGENSSFRFLNEVILEEFPYVKVTFFVPVGVRVGMIENSKIKTISKMINSDEEIKAFLKSVNDDKRFEIAYHGTTHGKVGKTRSDFKQEWETFKSLDEAIETIGKGEEIYKEVFGYYPDGGKYCGYISNEFSDESINMTGFLWWCRYYNKGLIDDKSCYIGGNDHNPLTNLDIKTFGDAKVVDIPTTVNGGLFTDILNPSKNSLKDIVKIVLRDYLILKKLSEIHFLLENNLVVSIQEHISPARDDGERQTPNIYDDKESLKFIFRYLKNKNIWYCTGTELAEYYLLKNSIKFIEINNCTFRVKYTRKKQLHNMIVSIRIDKKNVSIIEPNGIKINEHNGIFNIHIVEGLYKIIKWNEGI